MDSNNIKTNKDMSPTEKIKDKIKYLLWEFENGHLNPYELAQKINNL